MRVLISGSTGLIGSALRQALESDGHDVVPLVRRATEPEEDAVRWDHVAGVVDTDGLEGADAVVHLAGESIEKRWTRARKERIVRSRVDGTSLLAKGLAGLEDPPDVFVSSSAVGYYGDRGDEVLHEDAGPGDNFLAGVCQQWEAAAEPARNAGIRTVNLRQSVVLATEGGALPRMLTPFKMGVGGRVGSGEQWFTWITLADAVGTIRHCIDTEAIAGPVNACSPDAVRFADFARTLGEVLHRPTVFPLPAWGARMMFGEMADELLLASARMYPRRLIETGYRFAHPELGGALQDILGRQPS